jgi:hypothetical protein
MKAKQVKVRNETQWCADGRINGKRKRMFFKTKPQAESWIKAEQQDTTCQQWWLELSNADRVDMMNAFARSRDDGFTLLSAVDHFAVEGRGKKFLKKMTLEQALGNTGRDRRRKSQAVVPKASGFLGDKVITGTGHGHLAGLQCVLNNFVEFAGPTLECSAVSPELIKSWLTSGGALGKQWSRGAMRDYSCGISFHLPLCAFHVFPVMPSTSNTGETILYRSGLVRLYRRIAVRINSAPSLNCVLVIANR